MVTHEDTITAQHKGDGLNNGDKHSFANWQIVMTIEGVAHSKIV